MWTKAAGVLVAAMSIAMLLSGPAAAATVSWLAPTTYTDLTNIPPTKTITYRVFYGPSATGPWTGTGSTTTALSAVAPDPAPGATRWYTATAEVDGQQSDYAVAKSKTVPFPTPAAPTGLSVQ